MVSEVVYVVTEHSPVGETVLGVFSSLEAARRIVPPASSGRLQDYRIQGHAVDAPADSRTPWCVVLGREGSVEAAEPAVT